MTNSLLPNNCSQLEQAIANTGKTITETPIPLRGLWQPATCPAHLLPWLAAQFSVDQWDEHWPEDTKRQVIAASFYVHQHKGTLTALQGVIEPLGYHLHVTEWWQQQPKGTPGTFEVEIGVPYRGVTEEMYFELERLLDNAKPVSRHITRLTLIITSQSTVFHTASAYDGDVVTVYPYLPATISTCGESTGLAATHTIDQITVRHQ